MFQFSPAGKSDYLLGGFNAIVKMKNNGTAKFFGSDKQDIFGQGILWAVDAIVGIGTSSRKIGWKNTSEIGKQPVVYKSPPKETPQGARGADKVTKKNARKRNRVETQTTSRNENDNLWIILWVLVLLLHRPIMQGLVALLG